MTYATSNPPSLLTFDIGDNTPASWSYSSADAAATVAGAGYITNGGQLGMRVNDILRVTDTATPLVTMHRVTTVSTTSPGAVTVSAGVTVGNT